MPLTQEQLTTTAELLDQISALALGLREHIMNIEDKHFDSLDLSPEQIQELYQLYVDGLELLHSLTEQLPET